MTEPGAVERWVRRWGNPNEDGSRVYFSVPIIDFARAHDAEDGRLRELLREAAAALEAARKLLPGLEIHSSLPDTLKVCDGDCDPDEECGHPTYGDYRVADRETAAALTRIRALEEAR